MKNRINHLIKIRCRATTLPELLIVIILSGILFLLVFEGMDIINKFNRMLSEKIVMKEELFYSHSILELFLEEADSARISDENIILLYKAGEARRTIVFDSCGLCLSYDNTKDTIFTNNIGWEFRTPDEDKMRIDSILIKTLIEKDSLVLEYDFPNNTNLSNIDNAHATIR